MTILAIDDQLINLMFVEEYIKHMDMSYEVILCQDPLKAFSIIDENTVDVIILDVFMNETSGIDLLRVFKTMPKLEHVPIIMFTSLTHKDKIHECFELGATDYLTKPIEEIIFRARMTGVINSRLNSLKLIQLNEQLRTQNSELDELNQQLRDTRYHINQKRKMESIGELAAGVAHEINNPMGFIGSNLETMQKYVENVRTVLTAYESLFDRLKGNALPPEALTASLMEIEELQRAKKLKYVLDDLELIVPESLEGVERVTKIVRSLRNFAHTGFNDKPALSDLNSIIAEACLIAHNEAKYVADIELDYGDIPEIVCEKGQIGQVVLNLLVNAVHAIKDVNKSDHDEDDDDDIEDDIMEERRGTIIIKTWADKEFVCMSVADTGCGIEPENLQKIMDPFFTTKEIGKGTGLGLSITHDIVVNKHGGQLIANNRAEGGAIFTVKLNRRFPEAPDHLMEG